MDRYKIVEYEKSDSIFSVQRKDQDILGFTWTSGNCLFDQSYPKNFIRYEALFPRYYTSYQAYPYQMVSVFTRIGGLIGIFQIGRLLFLFHKSRFERQLLDQLRKSKQDFKENIQRKVRYHH